MAAMRYLELITPKGTPSPKLNKLVHAEGSERKKVLREILLSSYPFLFKAFELQKATGREIEEKFVAAGASGDTVRRCVAFFISAAQEAQIPLSPFLKAVRRKKKGISGRRRSMGDLAGELTADGSRADPSQVEWNRMLLSKFPNFDPAWPDEIKSKWFDAFARLKGRQDLS